MIYFCDDMAGTVEEYEADSHQGAGEAFVATFDTYGELVTQFIHVHVRAEDEEDGETITVLVHPTEPGCRGGRHDWEKAHQSGHGGGVVTVFTCPRCGWTRSIDTWGQDPTNGRQGYDVWTYMEPTDD